MHRDFHWSNAAVGAGEALVFDYHEMGRGPAASDVRNVLSSLRGAAADAFAEAYGSVDRRALLLDAPVATLAGHRRQPRPTWVDHLINDVVRGRLGEHLAAAVDAI